MVFSKHNVISRVRDTDEYFIMNFLSKQADVIPADMAARFLGGNYLPEEEAERDAEEAEWEANRPEREARQAEKEEEARRRREAVGSGQ